MQTHITSRLAKKLASYAKKHSLTETAVKFAITDPTGKPSRALVRLLINGYEPKLPETRVRLGLPVEIQWPRPRKTINKHLASDLLTDMPTPLLAWALDNRKTVLAEWEGIQ